MERFIRFADESDAEKMLSIYGPIVENTTISFETVPPSLEEFGGRIRKTIRETPWLVCETGGKFVGYAYASQHRERAAYQWSVDVSVYLAEEFRGQGHGRALYERLFQILRERGFFNAFAGIALPNDASCRLHENLGFKPIGVYRSVGYKLGDWIDVGWWQLVLKDYAVPPPPVSYHFLNTKNTAPIMKQKPTA
jgi:L-amino acid N-acyltransferase YncA